MRRIALLAIAFCLLPFSAVKAEASEGADISVSASSDNISITASGFSGDVVIRGYKANEYPPGISHGISKENMSAGECLGTASSGTTVSVSRYTSDGYDRLYERFAAVKDGIVICSGRKTDVLKSALFPSRNSAVRLYDFCRMPPENPHGLPWGAVRSARKDGKIYTAGITVKKKQKKAKKKSLARRMSDLIRKLLKG